MSETPQSKLVLPFLRNFYDWVEPWGYTLLRVTVGGIMLRHGWAKLDDGFDKVVGTMSHLGFQPPSVVAALVLATETLGAAMVTVGLLTRLGAAAVAIDLAVITFSVQWHNGFANIELLLLWGVAAFYIALRGGGTISVDRLIGREL
jgi:putative oxidoreductase